MVSEAELKGPPIPCPGGCEGGVIIGNRAQGGGRCPMCNGSGEIIALGFWGRLCARLTKENATLRERIEGLAWREEAYVWSVAGGNHLESMGSSMLVLISAGQLRELLADNAARTLEVREDAENSDALHER